MKKINKEKIVYVVHCIDTEGPLNESLKATFERLKHIYHLNFKPSKITLKKLQKGQLDLKGLEDSVKQTLNPEILNYNNSWNKINKMLKKKSGLSYCDVRERYENFRARCSKKEIKKRLNKTRKNKKEKGCVDPLYGKKTKCIIRIIPKEVKTPTLKIDKKCKKFN